MQSSSAAEVEDLGLAAEDGGDDPGGAGQTAGFAGGEVGAGVEVADAVLRKSRHQVRQ